MSPPSPPPPAPPPAKGRPEGTAPGRPGGAPRPPLVRALLAVLWTLGLAAALLTVDRLLVERPPRGWVTVDAAQEVPAAAGPVLVPLYLPERLAWPPARVLWRDDGAPGWWLGLARRQAGGIGLWIGTGTPPPDELAEAAGCLRAPPQGACPTGWHHLSTRIEGGRTIHVVGELSPAQIARILEGLQRSGAEGAGPEGRIR